MNALETNLTLWAICSIMLFESLIIICLCRCCCNRIKPKKFYLKVNYLLNKNVQLLLLFEFSHDCLHFQREEYEYLHDVSSSTQGRFQSTILRPPHADALAHIGTIQGQNFTEFHSNGIQNSGFYLNDVDQNILQVKFSTSQPWLELQSPVINTAQLSPTDYEIHSRSINSYPYVHSPLPRPTIIDLHQYSDNDVDNDDEQLDNYRLKSFPRPEITLPQIRRLDTSTEFYDVNYSNIVPKSILKTGINTTPPLDFVSTPYLQIQRSHASSYYDEPPHSSVKVTTYQSRTNNYPINSFDGRVLIESVLSPTLPLSSKYRMKFASVSQLNDVEWEVPREFQIFIHGNQTFHANHEQTSLSMNDLKRSITQQQSFAY